MEESTAAVRVQWDSSVDCGRPADSADPDLHVGKFELRKCER